MARRPVPARALRADVTAPADGCVLLWGEPKIGKTTLIRQVLWSLEPDRYLVARLPVGALAEPLPGRARGLSILTEQIAVQLEAAGAESRTIRDARNLADALDRCLRAAGRTDRRLIVALEGLDRYVGGVWPSGVRENLLALENRLSAMSLLATLRLPVPRLAEELPLVEGARIHFVPPLEARAARQLLTDLVAGETEFGHESLERLLASAGGRPFLIQIIARNSLRLAWADRITCITQSETDEIIRCCWLAGEIVFRPLLANLRPKAQQVLWALAQVTDPRRAQAPLTPIVAALDGAGRSLPPDQVVVQLDLLGIWSLVERCTDGTYRLVCGWLGDFLRACKDAE
jgi:hypothetical protein